MQNLEIRIKNLKQKMSDLSKAGVMQKSVRAEEILVDAVYIIECLVKDVDALKYKFGEH